MIPVLPDVSRETEARLRAYDALLHKWQKAINLVGPSTLSESWTRHIGDSLQILPLLPAGPGTLYDLGSGAGFPGLVLAIARPDLNVTLIESDEKKAAFLMTVSRETNAPVRVENARIESAADSLPAPDIITARALASLPALLVMARPWIEKNKNIVALFPKGARHAAETEEARAIARFSLDTHPSLTDPEARILVLRDIIFI